jgi:uncharacterized protein YjbI with pentapeptide repeats
MPNEQHLAILNKGKDAWDRWRKKHSNIYPDLSDMNFDAANFWDADFSKANLNRTSLSGANLRGANFSGARLIDASFEKAGLISANFTGADLAGAWLRGATLSLANFSGANLKASTLIGAVAVGTNFDGANLSETDLRQADLREASLAKADMRKAYLWHAFLNSADLSEADLREANLEGAFLNDAKLVKAHLEGANLQHASFVETNLEGAALDRCYIYGLSAWKVNIHGASQKDLVITPRDESVITVDNLEVAQFVYLLVNNEKIRDVVDTIGRKGVLILGRFTRERKPVLEAIREELRKLGFVPMVFDFEKPTQRDFTETIRVLTGLALFVIADVTNPRSSPLELQAIMPDYMLPFVPIIEENEEPFAMFKDLKNKYSEWVLDLLKYDSIDRLLKVFNMAIVEPALSKAEELRLKKAKELHFRHVKDYL